MARLKNTSPITEFSLKFTKLVRYGLEALARKHGLRSANEAAYLLVRQGLEAAFEAEIGSKAFFDKCIESSDIVTSGMALLDSRFPSASMAPEANSEGAQDD